MFTSVPTAPTTRILSYEERYDPRAGVYSLVIRWSDEFTPADKYVATLVRARVPFTRAMTIHAVSMVRRGERPPEWMTATPTTVADVGHTLADVLGRVVVWLGSRRGPE